MVTKRTWEEFRENGLLWLVNSILHLFGWAIVLEMDGEEIKAVYPARVKFRGFDDKSNTEGYRRVTEYLERNIGELSDETKE